MTNEVCSLCDGETKIKFENMYDDRYGYQEVVSIVECRICGHCFVCPSLGIDSIADLYEKFYGRSEFQDLYPSKESKSQIRRWLMGQNNLGQFVFHLNSANRLLDIGSGDCQNLKDAIELGFEAVGFDVDKTSAIIGKKNGLNVRSAKEVHEAFPDMKFDLVQMNQVLEHYVNPSAELKKLLSSVNKDGKLFISTPNASSIFQRIFGRYWINWHVPYHQHHFTKTSVVKILEDNGWQIETIKTVTPIVWFILQMKQIGRKTVLGERSESWMPETSRLKNLSILLLAIISLVPIRILDQLGQGDSLAIIARKKI